jgi:ABA DEFICIENT 4-like
MTPEQSFSVLNLVALAAWILLVVLPRQRRITDVISGVAVPAMLAAAYLALIAANWRGSAGGFSTLADVALLFSNPWLLLAGWTHYLAFDLLIGAWEVRDARSRGIHHWLVVPCLILTFLFGPAGWLLYMAMRSPRLRPGQAEDMQIRGEASAQVK